MTRIPRRFILLAPVFLLAAQLHAAGLAPAGENAGKTCGVHGMMEEQQSQMADGLQLNDNQRKAFAAAYQQMNDMKLANMQFDDAIKAAIEQETLDEIALREMVHKHNAESERNVVDVAKAMHAFQQTLSTEQKAKLKAMRKDQTEEMHGKKCAIMQDGRAGDS